MIAALFLSACEDCAFSFWRLYQQYGSGAHRLAVRTAPSHGANRGSIPLGRTSKFNQSLFHSNSPLEGMLVGDFARYPAHANPERDIERTPFRADMNRGNAACPSCHCIEELHQSPGRCSACHRSLDLAGNALHYL